MKLTRLRQLAAGLFLLGAAGCSDGSLSNTGGGPPATGGTSFSGGSMPSLTGGATPPGGGSGGAVTGGVPVGGGAVSGGVSAGGGILQPPMDGGGTVGPIMDGSIPDDASAGTLDAGPAEGASRCPTSTYLLCEDFEGVKPGAAPDGALWTTIGNELRVSDARAARGKQALQVTTQSGESLNFIRTSAAMPQTSRSMWGRLFLWVESPRPGSFSHWTVIEATGTHPAGGTARVRVGGIHIPNVRNTLDFNYDIWGGKPAGFGEVGLDATEDTPDETWLCLEWMFDVDKREARVFLDGVEDPKLHALDSINGTALDFPTFDGLNIGMATYQDLGGTPWRVFIDEVAVDVQRIGCEN